LKSDITTALSTSQPTLALIRHYKDLFCRVTILLSKLKQELLLHPKKDAPMQATKITPLLNADLGPALDERLQVKTAIINGAYATQLPTQK